MSINELIVLGHYRAALALVVDQRRTLTSQSLLDEGFLHFALTHAAEEILYPLFIEYTLRYEDRLPLQATLQVVRAFFAVLQQKDFNYFSAFFLDFVEDLIRCDGERNCEEYLEILNVMLQCGLDPNAILFEGENQLSMYIFALKMRNYKFMNLLFQFPGFVMTPELLNQLNSELTEIDQHREMVLQLLGAPPRANAKRSRYNLDDQ